MGGLDVAAVAQITAATVSLMGATQNNSNKKLEALTYNQQASIRKKKNLLDQQLASRRAAVGAMGVSGSKSSAAAQERIAKTTYDEIDDEEKTYKLQYQSLQEEHDRKFNQSLLGTMISGANKVIK